MLRVALGQVRAVLDYVKSIITSANLESAFSTQFITRFSCRPLSVVLFKVTVDRSTWQFWDT